MGSEEDTSLNPEEWRELVEQHGRDTYSQLEAAKAEEFMAYAQGLAQSEVGRQELAVIINGLKKRKALCDRKAEEWKVKSRELEERIDRLQELATPGKAAR